MWPFKTRYQKLKKDEVADAMYTLEKQEQGIEDSILEMQEEIDFLLAKGKKEKSDDIRLLYAKKINHLKQGIQNDIKKGSYLLYNMKLLKKLKETIEDKEFFSNTTKVSLGNLLKDQAGLAKYLNEALNTKVAAEEVLTTADETFNEVQGAYLPNQEIYGVSSNDDELLAVFDSAYDEEEITTAKVEEVEVEYEEEKPQADELK